MNIITNPTVFISYSWDDEIHKGWVRDLATRLRGDGVDVILDQWETAPGDQLPVFMDRAIRNNNYVLVVCTPKYKTRSDNREGGVGYEGDIMTAEVLTNRSHRKFIPILRHGTWKQAAPSWLSGKYYVDFCGAPYPERGYDDLLTTIYGARPTAPPLGPVPEKLTALTQKNSEVETSVSESTGEIKINGIVVDEVTEPTIEALRLQLASDDAEDRRVAATRLARMNNPTAISLLIETFTSDMDGGALEAENALVRIGSFAVPALINALEDRLGQVRVYAALALGQIGEPAKEAVPVLMKALRDEDGMVRVIASEALFKIDNSHAALVIPVLMEGLSRQRSLVRKYAAKALEKIGTPEAIKAVEEYEQRQ